MANSITSYKELLDIKSFWQRHTEHMLAEWIIRINDPGILGQSTLLRIKKAQQDLCSPKPIWFLDSDLLEISKFRYNLNTKILKLARDLDIEIKSEHRFEDWWLCQDSERKSRIIIELL